MGRKAKSAIPEVVEQEIPAATESDSDFGSETLQGKKMSKAGAARAALADGVVVPREAIVYIKDRFGIEMSPQQFSAEKCRLKGRTIDTPHSFSSASHSHWVEPQTKSMKRNDSSEQDLLHSLEVMKPLIDRLGAEKVKRMVDLLG